MLNEQRKRQLESWREAIKKKGIDITDKPASMLSTMRGMLSKKPLPKQTQVQLKFNEEIGSLITQLKDLTKQNKSLQGNKSLNALIDNLVKLRNNNTESWVYSETAHALSDLLQTIADTDGIFISNDIYVHLKKLTLNDLELDAIETTRFVRKLLDRLKQINDTNPDSNISKFFEEETPELKFVAINMILEDALAKDEDHELEEESNDKMLNSVIDFGNKLIAAALALRGITIANSAFGAAQENITSIPGLPQDSSDLNTPTDNSMPPQRMRKPIEPKIPEFLNRSTNNSGIVPPSLELDDENIDRMRTPSFNSDMDDTIEDLDYNSGASPRESSGSLSGMPPPPPIPLHYEIQKRFNALSEEDQSNSGFYETSSVIYEKNPDLHAVYSAIAQDVFAGPTRTEALAKNDGRGTFEVAIKSNKNVYGAMRAICDLLKSRIEAQNDSDTMITVHEDNESYEISLETLVNRMELMLNTAMATSAVTGRMTSDKTKQDRVATKPTIKLGETTEYFPGDGDSEILKPKEYNKIIADSRRINELEPVEAFDLNNDDDRKAYEEFKAMEHPVSILKKKGRSDSIPSLESDIPESNQENIQEEDQRRNSTSDLSEFWSAPREQSDDTFEGVYFAMLEDEGIKLPVDYLEHFDKKDLDRKIRDFIDACERYFLDAQQPTADDAKTLKTTFDEALKPIVGIINDSTNGLKGKDADDNRRKLKSSAADQLAELAANTFVHDGINVITKDAINGAVGLQRITLATEILNTSETVESGGGGYCGDRSIIQSMREAVRSGAIDINNTPTALHEIFQPRDSVGNEQVVSEDDAKTFRKLYVEYLRTIEASESDLNTVGDEANVYWLADQDMNDIARWLSVNLNVVQNVEDRDDTYSYEPEVGAESIGTINIFNKGNQHFVALLPISRTKITDDYEHVEPVVDMPEDEFLPVSEGLPDDFEEITEDEIPADEFLPTETDSPVTVTEEEPPAYSENPVFQAEKAKNIAGLSAEQLAAIEASRSRAAEERRQQEQELHARKLQEQEEALFGSPSKPTVVTTSEGSKGSSLRQRVSGAVKSVVRSKKSDNRVDSSSAPVQPKSPTRMVRGPGFVAPANHLQPELLASTTHENDSTVVTSPPRTSATRRVEPEESVTPAPMGTTPTPALIAEPIALDVHARPRPVPPKSLVKMVRDILDVANPTGLYYMDTARPEMPDKIELYTQGNPYTGVSDAHIATVTDPKAGDPEDKIGTVTAHDATAIATYNTMKATLNLIAAMPNAERTAFIHPISVRNVTSREQIIGVTKAWYDYCIQVNPSGTVAKQADALNDIYIGAGDSNAFKQALYEFLKNLPDDAYPGEPAKNGNYKAFVEGLLESRPPLSITSGSRGLGSHPPRTHAVPEYQSIMGLLYNYTPPKSFFSKVKGALIGDGKNNNPKNPRVI